MLGQMSAQVKFVLTFTTNGQTLVIIVSSSSLILLYCKAINNNNNNNYILDNVCTQNFCCALNRTVVVNISMECKVILKYFCSWPQLTGIYLVSHDHTWVWNKDQKLVGCFL